MSCVDALLSQAIILGESRCYVSQTLAPRTHHVVGLRLRAEDAGGKKTRKQGTAPSGARWLDVLIADLAAIESDKAYVPIFGPSGFSTSATAAEKLSEEKEKSSEVRRSASEELQRLDKLLRVQNAEKVKERTMGVRDLICAAMLWSWGEEDGEQILEVSLALSVRFGRRSVEACFAHLTPSARSLLWTALPVSSTRAVHSSPPTHRTVRTQTSRRRWNCSSIRSWACSSCLLPFCAASLALLGPSSFPK